MIRVLFYTSQALYIRPGNGYPPYPRTYRNVLINRTLWEEKNEKKKEKKTKKEQNGIRRRTPPIRVYIYTYSLKYARGVDAATPSQIGRRLASRPEYRDDKIYIKKKKTFFLFFSFI